ncbi:MAG: helix-turn-helix transcriptional regulator [Lachnospiraceae bacterium]|nr:helix-turn-helix transcriptional regulator [Lachnospiraceae bacterium]
MNLIEKPKISLAAARTNAQLKQKEMADLLGVDVSTIINWEKGKSEPSASQLRKISEISGIPMDFIFVQEQS